jgi:hypothetical protein
VKAAQTPRLPPHAGKQHYVTNAKLILQKRDDAVPQLLDLRRNKEKAASCAAFPYPAFA